MDAAGMIAVDAARTKGRGFWLGLNVFLCAAVALFSFRYLLGVGPVPRLIFDNVLKRPWLTIHATAAATALLVSPLQLIPRLRDRRPTVHRWLGRTYVTACALGGLCALPLAFGSSAGPVATAGFGLLAVAWLTTTLTGWRAARERRFAEHRAWMVRSFSLTFAAVTLRIYLGVLGALPAAFFLHGYRAVSFLCWVPNIVVAELLLRRRRSVPATP